MIVRKSPCVTRVRWIACLGLIAFLAVSCGETSGPRSRLLLSGNWDTVANLVYGATDSTFITPLHVRGGPSGIWISDGGIPRVALLDTAGHLQWLRGRRGEGPGEFRSIRDIEVFGDSELAVLDPRNGRISVLNIRGEFVSETPLTETGHAEQLAPLSGRRYGLMTMRPDSPVVWVDSMGVIAKRKPVPWTRFAELHPLATQNHTAGDRTGRRWVVTLAIGDRFWLGDGETAEIQEGLYIESVEVPNIPVPTGPAPVSLPLTPFAGTAAAIVGDSLFVLFGGTTELRQRLIDVYLLDSREYVKTYVLPVAATSFDVFGGIFSLILYGDNPHFLLLRYRG